MDITNNEMVKEICEHLDLMLSFAEKAGIVIDEIPNYSVKRDELSFFTEKYGVKEYDDELFEKMTIHLHEQIDKVKVIKETKYSHQFITAGADLDCQDYCTTCHQVVTEFSVRDGKLEVATASVTQTINENTYFIGTETIVNFSSIADFYKTQKLDSLPTRHSIKIETVDYSIPEDYHITDGVGPIDNNSKIIEKTILS